MPFWSVCHHSVTSIKLRRLTLSGIMEAGSLRVATSTLPFTTETDALIPNLAAPATQQSGRLGLGGASGVTDRDPFLVSRFFVVRNYSRRDMLSAQRCVGEV